MQQEKGGQNQQDRRPKPMQGDQSNQPQQHQPQKCPRCESLNTKFCYYNNYSLSQPRYFCKTCKRYWTQGGTLRNVPVGGGCRKGKRTKTSPSGENSRSSQPPPPPRPQQLHQNLTTPQNSLSSNPVITTNPVLRSKESGNLDTPSSIGSYYPGGGFLASLAAIQPLNQSEQSFNQPMNQPLNVVGGGGHDHLRGSSNLGLLQGYSVPSFGPPQHQQIHQTQFFQMGNREKSVNPMYHPSEVSSMNHSNRPGGSSSIHPQDWHQSFINRNTNPNVSDTALWSISTSTSSGNTNSNTNTGSASASTSLNPNQWPYLPGYGPPP